MRKILIILIVITVIVGASSSFAQTTESLEISISPKSPSAESDVTVFLSSDNLDLKNLLISWRKNGVLSEEGVGVTKHQTTVGGEGNIETIVASVRTKDGLTLTKEIKINPTTVTLIWEADSYTPLFYKGKGLPAHQSKIKVVALPFVVSPFGERVADKNLNYEWFLDNKLIKNQSGTGRNVFEFTLPLVSREKVIFVKVTNPRDNTSATDTTSVSFINPEILIYKENPLTGLKSGEVVRSSVIEGGEDTFIAEPYFFSREITNLEGLFFDWKVDGRKVNSLNNSKKIILGGESSGASDISVFVRNPLVLLQEAFGSFSVILR